MPVPQVLYLIQGVIDHMQFYCGFTCGSRQALAFMFDEGNRKEYEDIIQDLKRRGYDILIGIRKWDCSFADTYSTLPYPIRSDFDIDENYMLVEGMFDGLAEFLELSCVS